MEAVERAAGGSTNPLVNSGAIATVDLVAGADQAARWATIHDGLSRFAGRTLAVDDETYASASTTNHRNRALAQLLQGLGALTGDPDETVDLYTRQSCLAVTAARPRRDGRHPGRRWREPAHRGRVVDAPTAATMRSP